jgi:cysteine desulfurase / selenocysteine lyase
VDCHVAGTMLDNEGIALRTGGHCAYPLIKHLGIDGTIRISFYLYNDLDDVKKCIKAVKNVI